MSCAICLDTIQEDRKETYCGHVFHSYCIEKYLEKEKRCPVCRTYFTEETLEHFQRLPEEHKEDLSEYKIFKGEKLSLSYISKGWIYCWVNDSNRKRYTPVYQLVSCDGKKYIVSAYLRNIIRYDTVDEYLVNLYSDKNGNKFYCTSQDICNLLIKRHYEICWEWMYDVLLFLSKQFVFSYHTNINTLTNDLFIYYVVSQKLYKDDFQAAICSSVYIAIEMYNKAKNGRFLKKTRKKFVKLKKYLNFLAMGVEMKSIESHIDRQRIVVRSKITYKI
jgi:hypothetical protein